MDKDDRLMEELLKEHARKGSGADEDFLKDLEDRIDAEDKVVVMQKKDSPGNRWALSAGIAACLALGVGGIYFWQERQGDADIIAYDSTASEQIAAQSEPPVAYSEKKVAPTVEEMPAAADAGGVATRSSDYDKWNALVKDYEQEREKLTEAKRDLVHQGLSDGASDEQLYRAEKKVQEVEDSLADKRNRLATMAQKTGMPYAGGKASLSGEAVYRNSEKLAGPRVEEQRLTGMRAPSPSLQKGASADELAARRGADIGDYAYSDDAFAAPTEVDSIKQKTGFIAPRDMSAGGDVASDGETLLQAHLDELKKTEAELQRLKNTGASEIEIHRQEDLVSDQRNRVAAIRRITILPKPKPELSREQYGKLVENKFVAPVDERSALSTFAVDVDTASYANVRRMINEGMQIPKDSVRVEEMINYFDYQYAQPEGEHPFAVQVDSAACPWNEKHRIVRIGVQGKEIIREQRPPANLVFLLDVSGSMNSPNKLPLLKQSMSFLLEELNEKDSVSIVVYAGASGLALPATKMDDAGRQQVADAMEKLSAGGSTAGGQGIKLAYKVAKEQFKKDGINRIILATDGDFNVGVSDTDSLTKMVKEKAKEGTYLSVLGFGSGNINDNMLESITNSGNGNYSYIDTVKEGRKVLLEDMMGTMVTIAKDVKVQVVMNPKKVKAYRLIGYANRMLPPEAFLDKKVDAGEIGAGHTVTALYEIIPADGKPFGPEIDGSRYFEKPEEKPNPAIKDSDETMFVKLAYKKPDQKMDDESTYFSVPFTDPGTGIKEASADLKFASAVGLFGMVLRDSEYKGSGDLNTVMELATAGTGPDGKCLRGEFIQLVGKLKNKE